MFAQSVLPPKAGGAPYIHGCTPALTMLFLKWLKSVIFVSDQKIYFIEGKLYNCKMY